MFEVKSNIKKMMAIFFWLWGNFSLGVFFSRPNGLNGITTRTFCNVWGHICWRHPEQWQNQDWLIQHHTALVHCALSMQLFLAAKNMAVFPHSPYSPDLAASCIFFCEWNQSYRVLISRIHLKFRNNCWQPLMWFKQVNNLSVSSSIRNTDSIAPTWKGLL